MESKGLTELKREIERHVAFIEEVQRIVRLLEGAGAGILPPADDPIRPFLVPPVVADPDCDDDFDTAA